MLIAKRDTDFVRENMLINYCLGDEDELLIESFVRNNELNIRFDVSKYYFFMTGVHKKYVPRYTPNTFNTGVDRALNVYMLFESALQECGYDGNVFLIKTDNSKQIGVLFSEKKRTVCSPEEMSVRLLEIYKETDDPYFARPYMSTSFVGPYSGYEQLHNAFLAARELNDLLFFGVQGRVITEAFRKQYARPCDASAIISNYRRLLSTVCSGTLSQALRQVDYLIESLIAPSCSKEAFETLYIAFRDLLGMHEIVYDLDLPQPDQKTFLSLSEYREYLHESLRSLYRQLEGKTRYSTTILMALSCIHRNYTRELSLTQLAEYVFANPSTLSSEFNAALGISLSEYIASLRIERAKKLLAETDMTVAQIAKQSGFSGEKYFRDLFKKQVGLTPQTYRSIQQ